MSLLHHQINFESATVDGLRGTVAAKDIPEGGTLALVPQTVMFVAASDGKESLGVRHRRCWVHLKQQQQKRQQQQHAGATLLRTAVPPYRLTLSTVVLVPTCSQRTPPIAGLQPYRCRAAASLLLGCWTVV